MKIVSIFGSGGKSKYQLSINKKDLETYFLSYAQKLIKMRQKSKNLFQQIISSFKNPKNNTKKVKSPVHSTRTKNLHIHNSNEQCQI